ncbi:MAG: hypothetical protein LUG23_07945 [Oscillospiraceae bacterium]|nr:hypothetical protein [Oscillospiraceae bacterium]
MEKDMVERGLYYATNEFAQMIRSVGGTWNDTKRRPIVCLIKSKEDERLYWAIPMGNFNHRNAEQQKRLEYYIGLPERDIRSCFYHIGRTTAKSIFFISDAIPITDKYIETVHVGADKKPYIIKNPNLIRELERKLYRILAVENSAKNYYRQHITDVKKYLIAELDSEDAFYSEQNMNQLKEAVKQLEEGKVVTKTIEELEALAES